MEAAQIETRSPAEPDGRAGVVGPPIALHAAASSFLTHSGRAHDWFLDALADLASDLAAAPGELSRVMSEQHRLLRQFLDAQRSILRYWAEVDAEIADIVDRRGRQHGVAIIDRPDVLAESADLGPADGAAEQQLRLVLDDLWRTEHDAGRTMIELTRSAATHPAAEALDSAAPEAQSAPMSSPLTEILDVLDVEPSVDVLAAIDRCLERLVPVAAAEVALPEPVLPVAPPAPGAPGIGDPDAFARFWASGRPDERGWRKRPFVQALLPLASGFVLLTGVLAWIG